MNLEGRYRLLLLAYPLRYRRGHGTEVLTTLLDAAPPGRASPTLREAFDVVRGGLRQRFRLPVGRLVVGAAVLAGLTLGALGAAGGALGSHLLAQDPPGDAAARATFGATLGVAYHGAFFRRAGHFGAARSVAEEDPPAVPGWSVDGAAARLTASGWRVDALDRGRLDASQGGLRLRAESSGTHVSVLIVSAEPAATPVAAVLGWLAGAMTGWLLVGWLCFRRDVVAGWALLPLVDLAYWTYTLISDDGEQPIWSAYVDHDLQTAVGLGLVGTAVGWSWLRPRTAVIASPVDPRTA